MNKVQTRTVYISITALVFFLILSLLTQSWGFFLWSLLPVFMVLTTAFSANFNKENNEKGKDLLNDCVHFYGNRNILQNNHFKEEIEKILLNFLYFILLIALIFVIPVSIIRKRKAGVTGMKSALSSICLFLIVITSLLAYWFDYFGLLIWSFNLVLLILAAYFTKYIPTTKNKT